MNKALTDDDSRLKRLKFRSWHRGWKETDLILGRFADAELEQLPETELASYETLLDEDDDIIWGWMIGKESPPAELDAIVARIRKHSGAH